MEDRKRVQKHVTRRETPSVNKRFGIGQKVCLGEHRALGPTSRARGVEERREVIRLAFDRIENRRLPGREIRERTTAIGCECLQDASRRVRKWFQLADSPRIADQDGRAAIAEEILQFCRGIGRIQGKEYDTRLYASRIERQRHGGLLDLDSHAVSRSDLEVGKRIREAIRIREEF